MVCTHSGYGCESGCPGETLTATRLAASSKVHCDRARAGTAVRAILTRKLKAKLIMIMRSKVIQWFTDSAGVLLLAVASGMFITNLNAAGWAPRQDPLLAISMPVLFWIIGALELTVGLVCLFGAQPWLKATLILWVALMFLIYQCGLFWAVGLHGFRGYWGDLAIAFHVVSGTVFWTLLAVFIY